ncbi:MAG TPA: hypothetical protein VGY58_23670, partial [Gemmataceae bacterium]|nr:hypothetical protein [Gemmataceae bacterium]
GIMFASSIGGITELKINPAGPSQAGGVFFAPCPPPLATISASPNSFLFGRGEVATAKESVLLDELPDDTT